MAGMSGAAYAQKLVPIPVDELLTAKQFPACSRIQISPDTEWVAYTLQNGRRRQRGSTTEGSAGVFQRSTRGVPMVVVGSDIWLSQIKTGHARNITGGKGSSWNAMWSPDGRRLAFYSDRSGTVGLWIWDKASGSLRHLSGLTVDVLSSFESLQWTPDGTKLLTVADVAERTIRKSHALYHDHHEPASNVTIYPARADAVSGSPGLPRNLVVVDSRNGNVHRLSGDFQPMWYELSPDGRKVAISSRSERTEDDPGSRIDLFVVDLLSGNKRLLARRVPSFYGVNFSWSPNGRWIAYTTAQFDTDGALRGECFAVSVVGEEVRNLTPPHANFVSQFGIPLWDAGGDNVYLLSLSTRPTAYVYDALWRLSVAGGDDREIVRLSSPSFVGIIGSPDTGRFWSPDSGRSMILITRDAESLKDGFSCVDLTSGTNTKMFDEDKSYGLSGLIWSIDVSPDSRYAAFRSQDVKHSEDIWLLRIEDPHRPARLTNINPQFDRYVMGASRMIEWTSFGERRLRGALLFPSGYEMGKRYPLIVWQYPGTYKSMFLNEFGMADDLIENMQLFSTRGYAILVPDVPTNVGTPMRDINEAVIPGVEKVIAMGVADPDRLGLIGHSWGGYGVLSLISQTTRFKAAVSRSGVGADLIRYYTTMGPDGDAAGMAETELLKIGGSLWEKRNAFIENSPIFYLDKVETPLLLTHGTEDPVSASLSDEIFVSLRHLGKPVEYAKYEGEGHYEWDWTYDHQVDFTNRLINWFDEHLQNRSKNAY